MGKKSARMDTDQKEGGRKKLDGWEGLPEGGMLWYRPSERGWVRLMPKDGLATTSVSYFRNKNINENDVTQISLIMLHFRKLNLFIIIIIIIIIVIIWNFFWYIIDVVGSVVSLS